jgi:hypothetical protein
MALNLGEWAVRTFMLVLAGLVTLSILGSISAMSTDAGMPRLPSERDLPVLAPAPEFEPETTEPQASGKATAPADDPALERESAAGTDLIAVPAPPEEERPERWLEAIAYALLAIAGLLALLLVLLWRGVRALARIAEATSPGQQQRN